MDIPNEYTCPITQEIMKEPVCDNEGNTYDKQAIMKWLSRNRTSPISRQPLSTADLRPNIALKNLISDFNDKNKESTEVLSMREARLKRFDGSSPPGMPPPGMPPPGMQSVREPDPIIYETLIPDENSDEEMVFEDPPYTIPESITTFGGNVIQITRGGSYDGHKYLCKNYCCVNIPMSRTGYCKKCWGIYKQLPPSLSQQEKARALNHSWDPDNPYFKIHRYTLRTRIEFWYRSHHLGRETVFEIETKDKFTCARHVIKDIRTHNLNNITISDYPVSIDDEDIQPILERFFN